MTFSFDIPWYDLCVLALAAAGIVVAVYRYTVPPVSRTLRVVLILLRSAALILILFAAAQWLFSFSYTLTTTPRIALLADNSLSMTLTDGSGSRQEELSGILTSNALRSLASRNPVDYYAFSRETKPVVPESLRLNGASTDLAGALRTIQNRPGEPYGAVVLITDGDYNAGGDPVSEAEALHVPVLTIGVGDSVEQKDVWVEKIVTNSVAYVQSSVPLDATILAAGYPGRRVDLLLQEEGKTIARQPVTFDSAGTAEYAVHFSFTPSEPGLKKYTVRIPSLPGEVTAKNNVKSVLVNVLKNKMRIAMIAGAPSADVAAIAGTLHDDPNIDVRLYYEQPDGRFRDPQFRVIALPELTGAECIVLVGFPTAASSPAAVQTVAATLRQKTPVLFVDSRTVDPAAIVPLLPSLPFQFMARQQDEQLVFPSISAADRFNVLLEGSQEDPFGEMWDKLPPVYASPGSFRLRAEASLLSAMKISGIPIREPLLVSRNIAGAKSFAVLGYGIWRWKILAAADPETQVFFGHWLPTVVRWLVTRETGQRVRVRPTKDFFTQGEPAEFVGEVYDANYQPLDNAEVRIEAKATSGGSPYEVLMRPLGDGRYDAAFELLPEGDYTFTAKAASGGQEIGRTSGRFAVSGQSMEYADTRMNAPLLRGIAAATGGAFTDARHADSALSALRSLPSLAPGERRSSIELDLWNRPSLLGAVILLLAVEWFIRKRSGML